jgi:CxxH/CxxC protein (TIGR04129 family)
MQSNNIYCCTEHEDRAFDDFINTYKTFPIMEDATEQKCSYCIKKAKYILSIQRRMDYEFI